LSSSPVFSSLDEKTGIDRNGFELLDRVTRPGARLNVDGACGDVDACDAAAPSP